MKTVAMINLKGGVGKSVTACNLAIDLTMVDNIPRRVLVVDLDKQANTSKFFDRFNYGRPCAAELLTDFQLDTQAAIQPTEYAGLDIIPANMRLLTANKAVLMDCMHRQHDRLKNRLAEKADDYSYCLVDCPPDVDMAVINALVAADYAVVPMDCDEWAMDGLREIYEQIMAIKQEYNPRLELLGVLVTKYRRTRYADDTIRQLGRIGLPYFETMIRYSVRVAEAKSAHKSVEEYSPACGAAADYRQLAKEIARKMAPGAHVTPAKLQFDAEKGEIDHG